MFKEGDYVENIYSEKWMLFFHPFIRYIVKLKNTVSVKFKKELIDLPIEQDKKWPVFLCHKLYDFFSSKTLNWHIWRILLRAILSPGGNTLQSTNYTATSLPSRKLSKLDEPGTQNTAGEAGTSS